MSTNTLVLEDRNAFALDDLFTGDGNVWASMDSTYDRGLRAGVAQALRDHLGLIVVAAQSHIAARPQDRAAVLSFVARQQGALVNDTNDETPGPFEFDGGLGI